MYSCSTSQIRKLRYRKAAYSTMVIKLKLKPRIIQDQNLFHNLHSIPISQEHKRISLVAHSSLLRQAAAE